MRIASMVLVLASVVASSWVGAQTAANQTPPNRLQAVQSAKIVRVCIWPDYYGITYRNPRTQQLSGIDADMAQALAKDLGIKLEFVDSSFSKLIDDVTQNHCDVAMFAIGITPQRQTKLRFTQPHLASDIYGITSKTNRRIKNWADIDQAGSVVAIVKATLHEPIMKERLKQARLMVLDTPFAREQEVQSGRADVFMTDYPYSQRFLANADWARLVAPDTTYHITPYAYAMAPGDDVWHARMEQFVRDIKRDGRLQAAAKQQHLEPILAR
ncbi:MAG: ABC transporter substrate-binding protein [Rhodoferax sp.]|nr:ABC transporter substrate-binding protein [Rhodoferax sp.]